MSNILLYKNLVQQELNYLDLMANLESYLQNTRETLSQTIKELQVLIEIYSTGKDTTKKDFKISWYVDSNIYNAYEDVVNQLQIMGIPLKSINTEQLVNFKSHIILCNLLHATSDLDCLITTNIYTNYSVFNDSDSFEYELLPEPYSDVKNLYVSLRVS